MSYRAKDATQRLILVSMGYVADAHGWNSYQALGTLADDGLCSERTVSRHLRELLEQGIIEMTAPSRRARPTTYRLVALDPDREYDPDRSDDRLSSQRRPRRMDPPAPPEPGSLANGPPLTRQWAAIDSPNPPSSPYIGTGSRTGTTDPVGQARPRTDTERVFEAWVTATGKTRSQLTGDRKGRIVRYLRDYPVDDLMDACRGWKKHPHYRGENDRGEIYNDLDMCLRDAKHIELFRDLERGIIPPPKSSVNGNGRLDRDRKVTTDRSGESGRVHL
jgi:DNA-binding transcriptional ArsR family regulator